LTRRTDQTAHLIAHLRELSFELSAIELRVVGIKGITNPFKHRPEIALKHSVLQWISDQPLSMCGKEFI
jgi:hypothetical protein